VQIRSFLHLCSILRAVELAPDDVPSTATEFTRPPSWKVCEDARLFDKQSELHQGARLVHMGGDGKICLVESMFHNGGKVQVRALSLMTLKHHFQSLFAGF
jgi:hypothetical protein